MKATRMIWMLLLLVIVPIAIADVDVNTAINVENGDLDYSSTIMTSDIVQSNVNAIVNGDLVLSTMFHETESAYMNVDIDMNPQYDYSSNTYTTVTNSGDGMTIKQLKNNIKGAVDYITGQSVTGYYKQEALEIVYHLSRFFATKQELDTLYENEMMLHYRLLAIERTLEKIAPDEFCESKLEVMRDYNLPGATCGDWHYSVSEGYSDDDWIIGVKQILPEPDDQTEVNSTTETEETEPEIDPAILQALAYWDLLCDQGMQKWCLIAQQNRIELGLE